MTRETIGGYEVLEEIGRGGFAVVYRCRERVLGKVLALKMLTSEVVDERALSGFLEEGRKLAKLTDSNVVQVFTAGMHEHRPYIVMECVTGRTVRAMLRQGALPIRQALRIMAQVASGLKAIHACGIVHCDLSGNNVMVTSDGVAKILDLGLARFVSAGSSTSSTDRIAGTLPYMAPEVIDGRRPGCAADVFSFGVLLYEVVARQRPFEGNSPNQILSNIATREPAPLDGLVPSLPPRLVRLVEQCLQKNPADRLPTLEGVPERLLDCLRDFDSSEKTVPIALEHRDPRLGPPNPYHNRSMIQHPGDFVGRIPEVRRIFSRLNASPPGCISIVGDRRIGKSSLLRYVSMPVNRDTYLERADTKIMAFMDLQEHPEMTLDWFLCRLMGLLTEDARGRLAVEHHPATLDGMKGMIQEICGAGFRIAILLDEFEIVTTNKNFSLEFFSFLRFLANQYDVGYITSSVHDLQLLCHAKEIADSPFFNIFSTMKLTAFSEEESRELVTQPSWRAGVSLEPYYGFITADLAGYFPLFLQIACCHLFDLVQDAGAARPDLDEAQRRYVDEARPHYRFLWNSFDEHERTVISQVVRGKAVPESLHDVLVELGVKKYLVRGEHEVKLFSSTFDRFVQTELKKGPRPSFWSRLWGREKS